MMAGRFPYFFICISFCLLIIKPVAAQFYSIHKFTSSEGLIHSNVYRIFQDKKGFLWFGTEDGLSSYNGKTFTNYTSANGIYPSSIMAVMEQEDENKLICHYNGHIEILSNGHASEYIWARPLRLGGITRLLPNGNNLLFIDKAGRLFSVDNKKAPVLIAGSDSQNHHLVIRTFIRLKDGKVLLAANEGLFIYDNISVQPYMQQAIHEKVYAIYQDKKGNIAVGITGHMLLIKDEKVLYDYNKPGATEVSDIIIDRADRIWVAIPSVGILLLAKGKIENTADKLQLQNILINALFEDIDGNVWIATHGSGLYCVHTLSIINYPVHEGTINNYTTSVFPYMGNVYISSIGVISYYDGNKLKSLPSKLLNPVEYIYFVKAIDNKLYIGTSHGIIIKDVTNESDEKLVNTNGALALCKDARGWLWMARFRELCILKGEQFHIIDSVRYLKNRRINDIIADKNGKVYFGSDSGIIIFNGYKFSVIHVGPGEASNYILKLFMDSRGRLWFAANEGAGYLDQNKLTYFSTQNGLVHNLCTSIAEDKKGNIWIGTHGGLNRYDGRQFRKYDYHSGLIANEVLSLAIDNEDNLWVGTINGVSVMLHNEINASTENLPTYISMATISGRNYYFPSHIVLKPNDRSLHIDFAGLKYPDATGVEFRYKIENLDTLWHTTFNHSLEIPSLPPGNYKFVVQAHSPGESWSIKPAELWVEVQAPLWKNVWFILLYIIVALSLFYWIIKRRISAVERKKRELALIQNKMINLKQQALAALINPHFVFNCLNSIQNYIHKNDKEMASQYLADFASLIRMTLQFAQDSFITLGNEIERLKLYIEMEKLRFGAKLEFRLQIAPAVDILTRIPNMILQPYIENAIRHGIMPKAEGGLISVSISLRDGKELFVEIEDNGIGLHQGTKSKGKHTSMGTKLTHERLALLQQINHNHYNVHLYELQDENGKACGTRVEIVLSTGEPDIVMME